MHRIHMMIGSSLFILMFIAFAAGSGTAAEYTVDKDHSRAGFQVRHLVTRLQGEFKDFEGTFSFDEKKPEAASGKFTVKAASINTNHDKRDNHLRSADFFDAEKFPVLTFDSKKMTPREKNKYVLDGDLTLHGVTRPVSFDVEFLGVEKSPFGDRRAGFTATSRINRKDYGMVWNKVLDNGGLLVGEDIDIQIQVEAIEAGAKK